MKRLTLVVTALFLSQFAVQAARASEPAWCNPATFEKLERSNNIANLKRVHVYQVGQLTLAGLAVGDSDYRAVEALSEQYAPKTEAYEKSCTWYLNNGNADAEKAFNHQYLPIPYLMPPSIAKEYAKKGVPLLASGNVSMLSCAERHGYVAMGCQGMQHRGPSEFAMFLSFSGCTPEHSTKIANDVWGKNWVWVKTREAIARTGYDYGNAHPDLRARLQTVMSAQ